MPKFLLSVLLICVSSLMWGQDTQQEKLEQRKAQIQQEIKANEKMLQSVKKKEKSALDEYYVQTNKIKLKEKLINTTERQTKLLSNDMYLNQLKINQLNRDLKVLKEDYSKMILKSYKSRSEQSRAMIILSSENFLQAYKRAQYMKQYTSFRKNQGEEIGSKTKQLETANEKLQGQRETKKKFIAENVKERQALEEEKKVQQKLVNSIKKDKNSILKDIKKKQAETKNIDRQIDRLIREAIAEANRKAALEKAKEAGTKAPTTTASSTKIELTPEAKILAADFRANRGKLPWPVERGFISQGFGDQPHPIYHTLTIHNSGVEITTEQGSSARAVFAGEVTSVIVLSPVNKAVMIQHGDYFTVYQNLSSVFVSKGDKVTFKQEIGKIRTSGDTGKTTIKFSILQNTTYNNPEGWILNK